MKKILLCSYFFIILFSNLIPNMALTEAPEKASLWTYEKISRGLFDIGVGHAIRENCSTIKARKITALKYIWFLVAYAQEQGYTYKEIKTFVDDENEQEILHARVLKYYNAIGLDVETPEALCDFGKMHINKQTQVGKLLKIE